MAKIVKSGDVTGRLPDLQRLDLSDLQEEARRILEAAQAQAAAVLADARRAAEQLRAAAQDEGRRTGLAQGRAEGQEQGRKEGQAQAQREVAERTRTVAQALDASLRALEDAKRAMVRGAHEELLGLALRVARRIVGAAAARDPEVVRAAVARAIELASSRIGVVVRLHPRDLEAARAYLPELHRRFSDLEPVQLVEDESVGAGGCVATTREGSVDAALRTQLEEIERLLLGRPAEGPDAGGAGTGEGRA